MKEAFRDLLPMAELDSDADISFQMEREVPYLLLYRFTDQPDPMISKLLKNEAAYLISPAHKIEWVKSQLTPLISELSGQFGAFLIIDVIKLQSADENFAEFELYGPSEKITSTLNALKKELQHKNFSGLISQVSIAKPEQANKEREWWPSEDLQQIGCLLIGFGISPFYQNPSAGNFYPLVSRSLQSKFSTVIKKGIYQFVKTQTRHQVANFLSLSSRKVADDVWKVDAALREINDQFEFLPLVTPLNASQAWQQFQEDQYKKEPVFRYRMLPMDPELEKRRLYHLPLEDIDDPTLAYLFRDKRLELDKMLTMLNERETQNFLWSSIQLYGGISNTLLHEAENILQQSETNDEKEENEIVPAETFATAAYQEFLYLKNQDENVEPVVEVKNTINGLMVSKGKMLIGSEFHLPQSRIKPLLQHEIGTHVLTFYTGTGQPLKILGSGVPGYEELQEGLAVFAEYLVGGLTLNRLKTLAARVVAVNSLISDYDFAKTYELLVDDWGISPANAFQITMRVYRSGGLSKDAVYLKGLINLINYLKEGHDLEILLCGKIRQDYVHIMQELIARGIAKPLKIKPRYLQEQEALQRLKNVKQVKNLIQLTY